MRKEMKRLMKRACCTQNLVQNRFEHVIASSAPTLRSCVVFVTSSPTRVYAPKLMSNTAHAVRNAAAALKKAADPWNKEGRETADRIVSAAISVVII